VPYLQGMRESLAAVKAYVDYHQGRKKGSSPKASSHNEDRRDNALKILAAAGPAVTEDASKRLLALYGLPVTPERLSRTEAEAVSAANELGYPVVAKVVSGDLPHKAAAGGVRLDLRSASEVQIAYQEILDKVSKSNPKVKVDGVLIQPMIRSGLEIILGVKRDPQFGPIVMFGLGGIFVEAIRQTSLRLAPITESDVKAMIREVPAFGRLIEKFHKNSSIEKLVVELLLRLSDLAADIGDAVEEIDINPVILDPGSEKAAGKATVVDALIVSRKLL
jgi:acyl-CoA synthetase (NDP forming)